MIRLFAAKISAGKISHFVFNTMQEAWPVDMLENLELKESLKDSKIQQTCDFVKCRVNNSVYVNI